MALRRYLQASLRRPTDWNMLETPCERWNAITIMAKIYAAATHGFEKPISRDPIEDLILGVEVEDRKVHDVQNDERNDNSAGISS